MSDSGFREVQLSGKQVVFLFMALVVALVGVFLLGVRAGRGAIPEESTAQAASIASASPSSTPGALPASTPAPNELRYQETLQERTDGRGAATTPAPSTTPPAAAPSQPTATPTPDPKPTTTAKPAAPTTKPSSATAVWYVQVDSFSSASNASKRVAELKGKNISADTFDVPGSGARYKVKVGPMERAAADAMFQRLRKEGYKPFPPSR